MSEIELLNHYRNLYQIIKIDNNDLKKEIERLTLILNIKSDVINDLNKRIKSLQNINQKLIEELEKLRKKDSEEIQEEFSSIKISFL